MKKIVDFINNNKSLFAFLLMYFIIRVIFININYTEWGDTFRMIRGADYLSRLSWPWDEKRWPFYSILLIPGILLNAPILWGRILAIGVTILTLIIAYLFYLQNFSKNKYFALASIILISTSSVFTYWSIRVMADLVFAFLIITFNYFFIQKERRKINISDYLLSVVLLSITMTRLEGLFMLIGVFIYLVVYKNFKRIAIYLIPQLLIYFPWTLYAKVLYTGPVSNDYFDEFSTFVFDLSRFNYFLSYTLFLLVVPIFSVLIINKLVVDLKDYKFINPLKVVIKLKEYTPLVVFILLELLVGFVWTPSLPRIYMPLIPFFVMFAICSLENLKHKLKLNGFVILNLAVLVYFAYTQYVNRLYFLGASKILFALILLVNLLTFLLLYKSKKAVIIMLIILNIMISATVIYNQKDIYESVSKVNEYINQNIKKDDDIAYSDETGVSAWYLRKNGFYLPQNKGIDKTDQYNYLKQNNIEYLLFTNEFNRGSKFYKVDNDQHYEKIKDEKVVIKDLWARILSNITDYNSDSTEFETILYRVN